MKADSSGHARPAPGHRPDPLARLANGRLILDLPALSAGHLLTWSSCPGRLTGPERWEPSIGVDNRLLTSSNRATSLTLSSKLPLHFSQSLSPKLPLTLRPLSGPPLTLRPLSGPPLTLRPLSGPPLTLRPLSGPPLTLRPLTAADQPSTAAQSDGQPGEPTEAPFNTGTRPLEDPTEASLPMPDYNLSTKDYEDLEQARGAPAAEDFRDVPEPSQNQDARLREKKEALLNAVCCSLIAGANFTDAQNPTRLELLELCLEISEKEPEFVLKVALYTRQELNIRSTANFLLAVSALLPPCRPHLRRYICRVVRLPSDWIEVAKIYQSLAESSRKVAPYPSCLRLALADSFTLFDEYQLAKYNTRVQRCKREPGKRRRAADSSPTLKEDKPKVVDHFTLKKLIRWLHLREPAYHIMCLLGRRYPSDLQSFARSRLPGPWDSRWAGKRMKLRVPETWERQLSLHGNTPRAWEELMDHRKLPFMAMLRNLRNLITAGISPSHHERILERLTDANAVIQSRQFPFRFLSAHKVLVDLQERLEQKDCPLPTKQALVQQGLESIRLPKRRRQFLKTRRQSAAGRSCPSFVYRWATKRLEELQKHRDVRYDQDLLEKYRRALETAVEISATHNLPPLPGRTVVLCYVNETMDWPCLGAKGLYVPRAGTQEGEAKGPK
ncbi:telomerase protein component 1-like, partial [Heptranchias perlo]|uniref:telomerase protein component 1-like n=1 Tax=Heptranchias perlo TaxID=212740 RepID=UPI00355A04E1